MEKEAWENWIQNLPAHRRIILYYIKAKHMRMSIHEEKSKHKKIRKTNCLNFVEFATWAIRRFRIKEKISSLNSK